MDRVRAVPLGFGRVSIGTKGIGDAIADETRCRDSLERLEIHLVATGDNYERKQFGLFHRLRRKLGIGHD